MWDSRLRVWLIFVPWLCLAAASGYVDHVYKITIALPAFLVISTVVTYGAFRNKRPSRFKFEMIGPRAVRSAMGFEVHIKSNRIEYREGERVFSLETLGGGVETRVFGLKLPENARWDSPFEEEIPANKRLEISSAFVAAVGFIQGYQIGSRSL
jgi:hypothetical protein